MKTCTDCGRKLINAVEKALLLCVVCETKQTQVLTTPATSNVPSKDEDKIQY